MSNTNEYIITTLSSGSTEYTDLSNAQIQAPFSIGVPSARNLRLTGLPYSVSQGDSLDIFSREIIPPDGVTAAGNLIHWWKLTEDPAEGESVDYGTSGSAATNLTVVDASTATGPTELGSPTVFKFDGVNDVVKTQIIDGDGEKNSIADLMETNYYTMSYWIKDNGVDSSEFFWSTGNGFSSGRLQGGGQGMWQYYNQCQIIFGTSAHTVRTAGATGWKHYAIVVDTRASTPVDDRVGISYLDAVANPDGTVNDGNPHYSGYAEGVTDYWFSIGALVYNSSTTNLFGEFEMCDFRMYDRVLTPTEISNIAAGDWT